MSKRTKKVLFFSSVKDKTLFEIQQFYQIDISILENLGFDVYTSNSIADAFKFWKYNMVFAYFYRYSFFVALIAMLFARRTYFTGGIDDLDKNISKGRKYIIQKYFFLGCYILSKRCIIVSQTDMNNVKEVLGSHISKLVLSEHTINTKFYANDSDKENIFTTIGWQGTEENVIRKGIDVSLKLFHALSKEPAFYNYKFYIIGKEGKGTPYLKGIINQLGITDSVIFTGVISEEEKKKILGKSKYYFQLSKYEGFGVAALEALCSKNIVIHSGKGGLANRIYRYGIKIDIDNTLEEVYKNFHEKLLLFDKSVLDEAVEEIMKYYSNSRRKNDFKKLLIDNHGRLS